MTSRSKQACLACKKHKRRCDKLLPDCSLCRRTNRACVYGLEADPSPTTGEWSSLQARLAALESRLPEPELPTTLESAPSRVPASPARPSLTSSTTLRESTSGCETPGLSSPRTVCVAAEGQNPGFDPNFPASMFLDMDCYIWSRARPPAPRGTFPASVLALLGRENTIVDVSNIYFATIHKWLPMVSKKRLDMGLHVQNAGPDLAMLFLAMKLVTAPVELVLDLTLYREAKGFLARLESGGIISLLMLQAMVLIAVYEYGHAIYPAAWMTIGSCARYSDILGLGPGDFSVLGQVATWTEAEERRRVWWCVFVLDKIVALGSRRRCAIPEPPGEGKLPVDDEHWDRGEVTKVVGHPTSTPYQTRQSGFARLCQASIYLGRAIGLAREGSASSFIPEIMTLVHEMNGFASAVDSESVDWRLEKSCPLLAPRSVARSALFVVLDRFTCPEKTTSEPGYATDQGPKSQEELELQRQSMLTIEMASQQLHTMATNILSLIPAEEEDAAYSHMSSLLSPFIMDAIYAAAATFHWLCAESGNQLHRAAATDLEMFLDFLRSRWRLGGAYREILIMHDVNMRVATSAMQ